MVARVRGLLSAGGPLTSRPHDALFEVAFEDPADAAALLRDLLPPALRDAIAWHTLDSERGSFIAPRLADHHADLLFRAGFRSGYPGGVVLLLERQSTVVPALPQRVLAYQVRIWERCRKERPRARLPPVLAVLVSHAPGGLVCPHVFEELFEPRVLAIPGLVPLVPRCAMIVLDLAQLSDAEAPGQPARAPSSSSRSGPSAARAASPARQLRELATGPGTCRTDPVWP